MKSQKSKVKSLGILFSFIVYSLWLIASPAEAAEQFFEIKAKKFSFTPNIIKVNKGDVVRIRLISEDVHHGLFIDGYGIKTSAYPGQEGSLKFTAAKAGRYSFRCAVTCGEFHPYMVGYLVVGPNSRFYVYVFTVLAIGAINILFVALRKRPGSGIRDKISNLKQQ